MPHTKSAKKSLRKDAKRRLRNRTVKRGIKVQIKQLMVAIDEGTPETIRTSLVQAIKLLDKAAAKNVIHRNMAARKKSQLARAVNARFQSEKPATPSA